MLGERFLIALPNVVPEFPDFGIEFFEFYPDSRVGLREFIASTGQLCFKSREALSG